MELIFCPRPERGGRGRDGGQFAPRLRRMSAPNFDYLIGKDPFKKIEGHR